MGKTAGMVLGIVLLIVGIAIVIFGLTNVLGASQNIQNIQGSFMNASLGIMLIFFGAILIIAGGAIIYLTNIGKIFSYVAKETAPGVEVASHALGKGLASGVKKGWKGK
ncbi:MAG: hypothetical protein KKB31_00990 [Nanoarchaeota archaeon]|nr:hypothetical protein [Nanoarchaeota archaeon]